MKTLIVSMIALMSVTAMAEDINVAVSRVERNNNAVCTQIDTTAKKCINTACFYTVKMFCTSNSADFDLKVKMAEYTNIRGERVVSARKIKVIR